MKLNRGQILVGGLVLAVLLGLGAYILFTNPLLSRTFTISTGRETGIYYAFANQYTELAAENGVEVEVVTGAGSIQTLDRLIAGEVDMGFVQGGTTAGKDTSELESLGSMYYEPVWVFHRADLEMRYLSDLMGMRVGVGEVGSGVFPVATELLTANGIDADNTTYMNLSSTDAVAAMDAGELDAAFFIVSPQSSLIFDLLQDDAIEVLNMERAPAYRSRFPHLVDKVIPQGALDLVNNIPDRDIQLLTTTATLVVRKDTPEDLVLLMLPFLTELHRTPGVLELSDEFPNTRLIDLPMNAAADRYYKQGPSFWTRYLPPVWASVADRLVLLLIPALTILYPVLRGVPPVYRFGIRQSILRWYAKLKEIDTNVENLSVEELKVRMAEVDALETSIFQETNIPNGYLDELYSLVEHIGLVHDRLEKVYERRVESEQG
jgi:TRAP transporter TAXI family solute receptor